MMLREFQDSAGEHWKVWDVYPTLTRPPGARNSPQFGVATYVDPAYASGWLCFDCGREKRRFAGVPPGWEQWDVEALEELCDKATPNQQAD